MEEESCAWGGVGGLYERVCYNLIFWEYHRKRIRNTGVKGIYKYYLHLVLIKSFKFNRQTRFEDSSFQLEDFQLVSSEHDERHKTDFFCQNNYTFSFNFLI